MFFRFILVAFFLHAMYADLCPNSAQTRPCQCYEKPPGVDLTCMDVQLDQVLKVKEKLSEDLQGVELKLERVTMLNLTRLVLRGLDLRVLRILHSNMSSIEVNTLFEVADSLEWLDLSHNSFKEIPTEALQNLRRLKSLYLEFNHLEVLKAYTFQRLHRLFLLSLRGNRIKVINAHAFSASNGFEVLFLDWNELTGIPAESLGELSSIDILGLQGNKIDAIETKKLSSRTLRYIDLAYNEIRQIPSKAFVNLKNLENLDVSKNAIEYVHPLAFQGNEDTLEELELSYNHLDEVPAACLKNLTRLKYLILGSNNISRIRKDDFVFRGNTLYSLHLENNSLSYVEPGAFVSLDSLHFLHLNSNQFSTFPYGTYSPVLGTLSRFDIQDNPLYCDCEVSWLRDFMHARESLFPLIDKVKCGCPEEHGGVPLAQIASNRLTCPFSAPNPFKKCIPSTASDPSRSSCNLLVVILQISLTCLAIAFTRNRLF